jgi:hypothetical protein
VRETPQRLREEIRDQKAKDGAPRKEKPAFYRQPSVCTATEQASVVNPIKVVRDSFPPVLSWTKARNSAKGE